MMKNIFIGLKDIKLLPCVTLFAILSFVSCNNNNNYNNEYNKTDSTEKSQALILVNKSFMKALLITNEQPDSVKLKNAFFSLKYFEPIIFGVIPGKVEQKLRFYPNPGNYDVAPYSYKSSVQYFSYTLPNMESIFVLENPSPIKRIIAQWCNKDTIYFQSLIGDEQGVETESLYKYINNQNDKIYVLNNNIEMLNLNDFINLKSPSLEMSSSYYDDIFNSLVVKYCGDSLASFWRGSYYKGYSKVDYENELSKTNNFIDYEISLNTSGQLPFKTKHLSFGEVKVFPRYADRNSLGINSLENVYGINQFFMDHDLTSGFVHPFTANFYNSLPEDGYLMVFERSSSRINEGRIYYQMKSDLSLPTDQLGQNIAFCRQWKLSDFDLNGNKLMMKRSKYNSKCYCPQVKNGSSNPYNPEIPIWSTINEEGYVDYHRLNSLTDYDGGTVVIVWTTNKNQTLFMDMHGSIAAIITEAKKIKSLYNVDPTIGIYDAGTFARKFKADKDNRVDFKAVNKFTGKTQFVGAGYGYIKHRQYKN